MADELIDETAWWEPRARTELASQLAAGARVEFTSLWSEHNGHVFRGVLVEYFAEGWAMVLQDRESRPRPVRVVRLRPDTPIAGDAA